MERRKPITYLSLGCILPYLSPLKRIIDVSRIIGPINNNFPYRINHLVLGDSSFSIDGLKFTYRVFVEQYRDHIGNLHGGQNGEGLPYDVVGLGYKDLNWALAPGDIFIGNQARGSAAVHSQRLQLRTFVKCTVEHKPSHSKRTIQLPAGTKLRDALRSNIAYFLGRNRVHHVTNFEVETSEGILRLPVGLKFHIKQLSLPMRGSVALEAIRPIIIFGTLQKLAVTVASRQDPILTTDLFRTQEAVHVRVQNLDQAFSEFLIGLPHKKIHVSGAELDCRNLDRVFDNWRQGHQGVGTEFSVQVKHSGIYLRGLMSWMGLGGSIFQNATFSPYSNRRFTVRLDNRRQVSGYVSYAPNYYEEVERDGQPWMVTIRVEDFVYNPHIVPFV